MAIYPKELQPFANGVPELVARASSVLKGEQARLPPASPLTSPGQRVVAMLGRPGGAFDPGELSGHQCPVTGSQLPPADADPEGLRKQAHELVATLLGSLGQYPVTGASATRSGHGHDAAFPGKLDDLAGRVCPVTKAVAPGIFDKDQLRRKAHEFIETLLITFREATDEDALPAEEKVPLIRCLAATPAGSDARASLTIANEESTSSNVTLYSTNFVADSGYEIPSSRVAITPRHRTIPPKGMVTFDITISVSQQTPPGTYSGLVQAMGSKYVKAVLAVEVL